MRVVLVVAMTVFSAVLGATQSDDQRKGCEPTKGVPIDLTTRSDPKRTGIDWPVIARNVNPKVPKDLIDARASGTTAIRVVISESGCVEEATVTKSTHKSFDEPALAAVRQWRYTPARRNGVAIPVVIVTALSFDTSTPKQR